MTLQKEAALVVDRAEQFGGVTHALQGKAEVKKKATTDPLLVLY